MGRYDRYTKKAADEPEWKIHPVWRGIGCMLIILLPVMAYAGASVLVQANLNNGWVRIPPEAAGTVTIPYVASVPYFYAILAVALILLVIGFGVLIIIYSAMYRVVGPPRYGPLDAPPPKRPRKKRRLR